ncbi:MAG: NTP transferase domain-containing protein [Chlamydiae bacterium]|nr:NTP transferase domain-containing protein [Chlamydiota bacterium]MBI3265603.1 NTP transferase domain-containing protein [Chlamydiota bacterium]
MKALILAAGVGKRLSPYTDHSPKCVIEFGGTTLIERMLKCLKSAGVKEVYIVIGHLKEKIQKKVGESFGDLSIQYIVNPRYQEGSILSLYGAKDILKGDDFLIMDADVLFPLQALERLVHSRHANCLLLDQSFKDTAEEMKLGARDARVYEIARKMSQTYEKVGEGVGFLKVSQGSLPSLVAKLDEFYQKGRAACEYEDAMNEWFKIEKVGYEPVQDLPWTEVDFYEDLRKAWLQVLPKVEHLENSKNLVKPLNRRLSYFLTRLFLKTPIIPNQITVLSFLSGLVSLFFFSRGGYRNGLIGALFFQLFYVLDNCDGEVARAKALFSKWGGWMDIGCDGMIHALLFPSIAWGLCRQGNLETMRTLGWIASAGSVITFFIFMAKRFCKAREGKLRLVPPREEAKFKILGYLKAGDFSIVLACFAILGAWQIFLWASAIGLHLFWISALLFHLEEASVG